MQPKILTEMLTEEQIPASPGPDPAAEPAPVVAVLLASGVEQEELIQSLQLFQSLKIGIHLVAPSGQVRAWNDTDWGTRFNADVLLADARPEDYAGLFLPGGIMNPDALRSHRRAERFVAAFFAAGRPVAGLCHGPWKLIDAGLATGGRIRAYRSWRTSLHRFARLIAGGETPPAAEPHPPDITGPQIVLWQVSRRSFPRCSGPAMPLCAAPVRPTAGAHAGLGHLH